jgi:peptidylprolyl isomerase
MTVKKGDKIKVEYEGRFEDGTIFDSSASHGSPLDFTAGVGMVVPGFDSAVIGMKIGDEKEIKLLPEKAYGPKDPRAIQKISSKNFPKGAKVGMQIGIPLPNGEQFPATIVDMNATEVTIDMNHPLAEKTLIFKIKLVEILK